MRLEISVLFSKQRKHGVHDARTFLQVGSPFDANPDANGQKNALILHRFIALNEIQKLDVLGETGTKCTQ